MISAHALSLATELRDVLREEVARSEAQTALLAKLAVPELLQRAASREVFNARAAKLQAELQAALAKSGTRSLLAIPLFQELHQLATLLQKRDALNMTLAKKTLSFTNAYLSFLAPRPSAYDRRGQQTDAASVASSVSGRA